MFRQRKSLASLLQSALRGSRPRPIRKTNPLRLEHLESREVPATFTVVNTGDSGLGSLRQAILDANSNPGPDLIGFDMSPADPNHVYYADDGVAGQVSPASITVTSAANDSLIADLDPDHPHSWWSIKPTTNLPTLNGTTTIDGYTQAGSSVNTGTLGLNAVLKIELNGSLDGTTPSTSGLIIGADDSAVRGLSINSFTAQLNVGSVADFVAEGNYLGVDPSGLRAGTSQGRGVNLFIVHDVRIGTNADGTNDAAERNLISGATYGVTFRGGSGGDVAGNLIGTDRTGTRAIPNLYGVHLDSLGDVLIGGTTAAARNVISGNTGTGIQMILTESTGNTVQGNYIGVDVTGAVALGNNGGISMDSNRTSDLLIGGTSSGARNVISGNRGAGIILGTNSHATVQGNYIGTDSTGTLDIGNKLMGILLVNGSVNNLIGGMASGAGNLIAYNGPGTLTTDGDGIRITGIAANNRIEGNTITGNSVSGVRVSGGTNNSIRGNSIEANGGLGIDLHAGAALGGVTPNDLDDVDTGPNGYQNFPIITSAGSTASNTLVVGSLNSTPASTFTIDFYSSPTADPTLHGEGKTYLGSTTVTTDAGGDTTFSESLSVSVPIGHVVSATATGSEGTSEFSGRTTVVDGNNAPNDLAITGGSVFENEVFTLAGTFSDADANDEHTVTVNWGEGDPEVFILPAGERSFSFDHRYLDDNPTATGADDYHPTVTVSDGSLDVEESTTVRVTNIAPSNLRWSLTDHDIAENGTSTINVTFDDPGTRDSHLVTIDWGDGAVETYTVAYAERSFSHTHTYRDDNPTVTPRDSYVVGVSLVDDDGGVGSFAPSVIYGLKSQGGASSSPPTALYSFRSDGTGFTDIGRVEINDTSIDADALAYSPTRGMFAYQMLEPDSLLISIDPVTAAATPIGAALVGREIRAATFDHDDRLWVLDSIGSELLEINPANGQIVGSPVGLIRNGNPYNLSTATDMAVRNDGTLVVVDYINATIFYSLDPVTGALSLLHSDSDPQTDGSRVASAGLAFPTWHADELFTYDVNGREDVYRYDVAAGYQRSTFFPHIIPSFNSGRGDLASAVGNSRVFVNNVAPSSLSWSINDSDINEGDSITVSGTFSDPGTQDVHAVTIDWGDGETQTYELPTGDRTFAISHRYIDDNPTATPRDSYVVGVSLVDDDSGVATAATSLIYGLKSNNGGSIARTAPPTRLYSFNSDGTGFVDIGTVKIGATNIDADALAVSPALGLFGFQMIHPTGGAAPTSSVLLAIDPTTAVATPIGGELSGRVIRGVTFDSADRLWVLDSAQNQLLQIDPSTGLIVGTPLGLTLGGNPHDLNDTTDIAVRNDGTFFVNDKSPGTSFYTLDPATGALTLVATDSTPGPDGSLLGTAGLAFTAHRADEFFTYEHNGDDDLFRYDLANGFARSTLFADIIPSFNSGRGDLASAVGNTRVFVNNLDPVIETITATAAFGTGLAHLTGNYSDIGTLDTHTLTIDWGHGSPETVTVAGGIFHLTHQYPASSIEPGNQYAISAVFADDDTGVDSAVVPFATSSISGAVFDDTDGDGIRDDGEPGLADWIVYVDGDNDGIRDGGEPWKTTGGSGEYILGELPAGTHRVRLELPTGWIATGSADVNLGSGDAVEGIDLGAFRLGTITGGQMFEDENGNGTRDDGEPGLGNRVVFLDDDDDGVLDPGESSVVTDANGGYSFGDLPIGDYRIRMEVPAGYTLTTTPVDVSIIESGQTLPGGAIGITLQPTSLSGFVWLDADDDGLIDATEQGVGGVRIELSGVNDRGETVTRSATTDSDGQYLFDAMRPGTYQVREVQPSTLIDGRDAVGSLGGTLANDLISGIYVDAGQNGIQYNFGERAPSGSYVHKGQTATIGFWQNKNGQALIQSLNGGPHSTALGHWLSSEFPNMYGAGAGANNLTGKTNAQIAAYYLTLFKMKGQKLEAQVFATAMAVYSTNTGLAGTVAAAYGFEVSATGTGAATYNVGSSGAAFGVANNTTMTVLDILRATNARSSGGVLYAGTPSLRNAANTVFDGINNLGDIG